MLDIESAIKRKKAEEQKVKLMETILELASEINFHEEALAVVCYLLINTIKVDDLEDEKMEEAYKRLERMFLMLQEKPLPDPENAGDPDAQ